MSVQTRNKKVYKARILKGPNAETVHFLPRGEDCQARPVTMSITTGREKDDGEEKKDTTDRLECFFMRDPKDTEVGGIADLLIGEAIVRIDQSRDLDRRPYTFVGEILEKGLHYCRAVFERKKRVVGAGR